MHLTLKRVARAERLAELRRQIQGGTYEVDSQRVAEAILRTVAEARRPVDRRAGA